MKQLISRSLFALLLLPALVQAADSTGVWKADFETQVGTQNYTYTFMTDGAVLTGTISSANGETPVVNGKVDGNTLTFTEMLLYQGMELTITYTGEFVSDNEISFTRDVAGFAMETLTARRVE
jgi:hypothetical protein